MAAKTRRQIAEELIALEREIAPTQLRIDALKDELRGIATAEKDGFYEDISGDKVFVSAPTEEKFKGLFPVFNAAAFVDLPKAQQARLTKRGLVAMEKQWTEARKPSVRVELAGAAQPRKR